MRSAHRLIRWVCLTLLVSGVVSVPAHVSAATATVVGITGTRFTINGQVTYPGRKVRGLLLNSRMADAVFDDDNSQTVSRWAYPDTGVWDPQRNTNEFVAMLPTYASYGLKMVTVSLQGGLPDPDDGDPSIPHPEIVSAFKSDGTLKTAWMTRLDQVIRAADANGIVVAVSLFYRFQDERIATDAGVVTAVDGVTNFIVSHGYTNVLFEVCNECSVSGIDHANLAKDEVWKLIRRVQTRSNHAFPVSSSFGGPTNPPPSVIKQADYLSLHCNVQTTDEMTQTLDRIRSTPEYIAKPKPIVDTECGTEIPKMETAVTGGAGWGYHDQGDNNYTDGFQSPPINWSINTTIKKAFFDRLRRYAGL
jgi:hypothetical protein